MTLIREPFLLAGLLPSSGGARFAVTFRCDSRSGLDELSSFFSEALSSDFETPTEKNFEEQNSYKIAKESEVYKSWVERLVRSVVIFKVKTKSESAIYADEKKKLVTFKITAEGIRVIIEKIRSLHDVWRDREIIIENEHIPFSMGNGRSNNETPIELIYIFALQHENSEYLPEDILD